MGRCYKYTDNFIKLYINLRSAFTGYFSEDITNKDDVQMFILDYSLKQYFNIDGTEDINE